MNWQSKYLKWNEKNAKQIAIHTSKTDLAFHIATNCYRCCVKFDGKDVMKIYKHAHLFREYQWASCKVCNDSLRTYNNIPPVIFHNFKHYDAYLMCKYSYNGLDKSELSMIAQSWERYIPLTDKVIAKEYEDKFRKKCKKNMKISFGDSFQHLPASLAR